MRSVGAVDHPFMKPGNAGAPPGVILMTADKGLAGAFNSNVIRAAEDVRARAATTVAVVHRRHQRRATPCAGLGTQTSERGRSARTSKLDTAREVARRVTDDFIARHDLGEIVLISSKLVTMMSQRPETRNSCRSAATLRCRRCESGRTDGDAGRARGAVEFAPSPEFVLSRLLPKYLEFTIYSAMLETDAAFFAAQLVAMSNATDNASKLIDELTIQMNNARQAAITKELLEIVGGAEALGVK